LVQLNNLQRLGSKLGLIDFIQSSRRVFQVASKPSRDELWMLIRVTFLGVGIVGAIGFMIKVLFWIVGLGA
jgi:protein translocase SEC61 complex gamma subunit